MLKSTYTADLNTNLAIIPIIIIENNSVEWLEKWRESMSIKLVEQSQRNEIAYLLIIYEKI